MAAVEGHQSARRGLDLALLDADVEGLSGKDGMAGGVLDRRQLAVRGKLGVLEAEIKAQIVVGARRLLALEQERGRQARIEAPRRPLAATDVPKPPAACP